MDTTQERTVEHFGGRQAATDDAMRGECNMHLYLLGAGRGAGAYERGYHERWEHFIQRPDSYGVYCRVFHRAYGAHFGALAEVATT